jgi:hypothetical protein
MSLFTVIFTKQELNTGQQGREPESLNVNTPPADQAQSML